MQGGPGLPMLHPAVYQYMITGKCTDINVSLKAIPDAGVRAVIDQVFLHIVLPIRVLILKCILFVGDCSR